MLRGTPGLGRTQLRSQLFELDSNSVSSGAVFGRMTKPLGDPPTGWLGGILIGHHSQTKLLTSQGDDSIEFTI